jgi:hypothetical protein
VIDLRCKNVKWYHFVNFVENMVVLGYSLEMETEIAEYMKYLEEEEEAG